MTRLIRFHASGCISRWVEPLKKTFVIRDGVFMVVPYALVRAGDLGADEADENGIRELRAIRRVERNDSAES